MLQQAINKLEEDLDVARKAQDTLDDQKQENVGLCRDLFIFVTLNAG